MSAHWAGRSLTTAGARECLRLIDADARFAERLDALLPAGCDARELLSQRRDGVVGSAAERSRIQVLEHAVYRPGASADAETELSALLLRVHERAEALDRAVEASGMLEAGAGTAAGGHPVGEDSRGADSVGEHPVGGDSAPATARPRRWWTRTRLLVAALGVVAVAAVAGNVVQASVPRPSLDVFSQPADPPDAGRSDFVTQVIEQGVMGSGPVRYLGQQHGVRVFAALVGDTYHNPIDPQEGICLTGFLGGDRLASSTTNCALRDQFDRLGVAVFFTESPSGELQASATGEATRAIVWGPTGSLREVDGEELERLVAAGCARDDLSFRAREDCAR